MAVLFSMLMMALHWIMFIKIDCVIAIPFFSKKGIFHCNNLILYFLFFLIKELAYKKIKEKRMLRLFSNQRAETPMICMSFVFMEVKGRRTRCVLFEAPGSACLPAGCFFACFLDTSYMSLTGEKKGVGNFLLIEKNCCILHLVV